MKNIFNGIPAEFFVADIPRPSNYNMTEKVTESSSTDINLIESSTNSESLNSIPNEMFNNTNMSLMENSNP